LAGGGVLGALALGEKVPLIAWIGGAVAPARTALEYWE